MLVSSGPAVCIDDRPIPGDTNEIGAMPALLKELHQIYGRTGLFDTLITDAGNASQAVARWSDEQLYGYILAIKENHGEIHIEAKRALNSTMLRIGVRSRERGANITYRLYRKPIAGYLSWTHARQLVRVERLVEGADGSSQGNRYFISNLPFNRLNDRQWLKAVRAYWRVENEGNWVADVFWREDARRTPWTTAPEAIYVMSALRMLAINIVSVLRAMSRQPGLPHGKLPWQIALGDVLLQLTAPIATGLDAAYARV